MNKTQKPSYNTFAAAAAASPPLSTTKGATKSTKGAATQQPAASGSSLYHQQTRLLQFELQENQKQHDHYHQHLVSDSPSHRKFPVLYPDSKGKMVELSTTDEKQPSDNRPKHRLGELVSTAICGNDILSSLLFVTSLTAIQAGIYAPIAQLLVVFTLWLYKGVYCEVLSALPMNGGTFNVLLHTTSKPTASLAACFSILSYVATCVCSGTSAIAYLRELLPELDLELGTVLLLTFFATLNLLGISESGAVALLIFSFHTLTLSMLCLLSIVYVSRFGFEQLWHNWHGYQHGTHNVNLDYSHQLTPSDGPTVEDLPFVQRGFWTSVFYGFGTAMLGVSGFESSSQFIEEQASGVFPLTLNNMWTAIAIFNPLMMVLALCVFPLPDISSIHKSVLLSAMGREVAGEWFHTWVSLDAFMVLAGAVLTAFVGVTGLVRRLALERCMPDWLLQTNPCRHTNHNIIIGFLLVCVSMFLLLNGKVSSLSEMYSFCFLSLLLMFAAGHMMLRIKRSQLPRGARAPWWTVLLGAFLVLVALMSIIKKNPNIVIVFVMYFSVTCVLVGAIFFRMPILKILLRSVRYFLKKCSSKNNRKKRASKMDSHTKTTTEDHTYQAAAADQPADTKAKHHPTTQTIPISTLDIADPEHAAGGDAGDGEQGEGCIGTLNTKLKNLIKETNTAPCVFFTKKGSAVAMNKAVLYIRENEDTQYIKMVHFAPAGMDPQLKQSFANDVAFLDRLYPKYSIDLIFVDQVFNRQSIRRLALHLGIPVNRMFIGCPSKDFKETVATLGGVRVITH